MMRVAFIEQDSKLGGVEMSTLYLARSLHSTAYEPLILLPEKGPLAKACEQDDIAYAFYRKPAFLSASMRLKGRTLANPLAMIMNPLQLWRAARSVTEILRSKDAHLVVTKGLLAHLFGGLAARQLGLPSIWHVQDEIPERRANGLYLRFLQQSADRLADVVIGDAISITRQYSQHSLAVTIYNGVDTSDFAPGGDPGILRRDLGIPQESLVIGNMARLTDWKGQHVLIEAFKILAEDYLNLHLVLIGSPLFDNDTYARKLERLKAASKSPDRIHFAGYRSDTSQSLAALDLYIHPSLRKDTAPLSLLSAMATGLPVIISEVPGMVEVVEAERDALIVAPGDSQLLANQIRLLLDDESLRERLGACARQSAITRFSIETFTASMLRVFDAVVHKVTATHLAPSAHPKSII